MSDDKNEIKSEHIVIQGIFVNVVKHSEDKKRKHVEKSGKVKKTKSNKVSRRSCSKVSDFRE